MTQTEPQSKTELFIHRLYEDERPTREWMEKPEAAEQRNALALALIDLAIELHARRAEWRTPIWQFVARGWWRDHAALPTAEMLALSDALRLNGITAPGLYWE